MSPAFKHINADQQIMNGTITSPLFAPGAVTVLSMNINGDLNFNEHQALEFRIENVSSTPAPGNIGRVVWNTTSNQFLIDTGTAFIPVSSSGAVTGVSSDSNPILTGNIQFLSGTNITLSQIGQAITINSTASGLPSLTDSKIWVGNSSNIATEVLVSGDATLSNVGILTLTTVNSNTGSFTNANITVDAKGRIVAASNGSASINYNQDLFDIVVPTSVFTLTYVPISNSQIVFWNGMALAQGISEDYVLSGNTVTLNGGITLSSGDKILIVYAH